MKENNYISEDQKKKKKTKKKKGRRLFKSGGKQSKTMVQIMNGEFLTKTFFLNNLTYIFFVIFLLILINGLKETYGLSDSQLKAYFEKKSGITGFEIEERLTELVK